MAEKVCQNALILSAETEATRVVLEVLTAKGIRGTVLADAHAAMNRLADRAWDLILVDLRASADRAVPLLRMVKDEFPELPVVFIGDPGGVAEAVEAMRQGCEDFLPRPVRRSAVEAVVERLLPNHDVPLAAGAEMDGRCLYQIAGRSEKLLETIGQARRVASSSAPALITGESGTGKELISHYLHHESRRSHGPYVRVNCAAVSETLLETELFGHERGAFTGAYAQHKGRLERAHGGTLLLDEISETGPRLQAELLRVLEQQDFERVGGSKPIRVNVRIISTTNRDLAGEVERRRFRLDLYYRIGCVRLNVPPLRQRKEDIPVLTWHFVNLFAPEAGRRITGVDPEMLEIFNQCAWPGNVRQLKSAVRTALILGDGPILSLGGAAALKAELLGAQRGPTADSPSLQLRELERNAIFEALRRTQRNQAKAARLLGITDRTLREKLRRYRRSGHDCVGEGRWAKTSASLST